MGLRLRALAALFGTRSPVAPAPPFELAHGPLVLRIVSSARARRYLLRLDEDGAARLVIPRGGSRAEAMRFLERSRPWLERRHEQWRTRLSLRPAWQDGSTFLFRGEPSVIRIAHDLLGGQIAFADQVIRTTGLTTDPRAAIHGRLRELAKRELPPRTHELARAYGITIRRILIRGQKTRWGSCSASGTISLNWRLIQASTLVQDYLITHELMHRRQMNHSARYWKLVAEAFPRWREAEAWLKTTRIEMLG